MLLGRVLRIRNWWDEVNEHVVLGAYPFENDVPKLAELGIKAVVNTCQEYEGPQDSYREFGIEQHRMPTVDFTHPTLDAVESAVEFIEKHIALGQRVYVHCKAGRARSATVVACWLIQHFQMTADEAQTVMLKVRGHVNPRIAQRPVVLEFQERHLRM